jgi:hypothetical protein
VSAIRFSTSVRSAIGAPEAQPAMQSDGRRRRGN